MRDSNSNLPERYVPAALEFSKSIGGTSSSESSSDRFGGFVDFPQQQQEADMRDGDGPAGAHKPHGDAVYSSSCSVHQSHEHNYGY